MSDGDAWEDVGRELLQYELESNGGDLYTSFNQAAGAVSRGESVGQQQIDELYNSLRLARIAINQLARATGNEPEPEIMELLDRDELDDIRDRMESDQRATADGGEVEQ